MRNAKEQGFIDGAATNGVMFSEENREIQYPMVSFVAQSVAGGSFTPGNYLVLGDDLTDVTHGSAYIQSVVTNIIGEADGAGNVFEFLADGHRIDADSDTPVGRGWLLPPDSTDDWIVRAVLVPVLVPEPGTAWLVCAGLVGLSACRSRATQPA